MHEFINKEIVENTRKNLPVRFGPIGETIFNRTYSRKKKDGSQEDWYDTCARVVNGNLNYVSKNFVEPGEAEKLYELLVKMEAIPAGRHLWTTNISGKANFPNNCFSGPFTNEFTDHFVFTFMRLMEGGGVGANYSDRFINSREGTAGSQGKPWSIKSKKNIHITCSPYHQDYDSFIQLDTNEGSNYPEHFWLSEADLNLYNTTRMTTGITKVYEQTYKSPITNDPNEYLAPLSPWTSFQCLLSNQYVHGWDAQNNNSVGPIYIRVEDSREGWSDALKVLLNSFINDTEERDIVFDISNIRPYGAELRTFGGKASGPCALILLLLRTARLLNSSLGRSLDFLDYMSIDHYIAQAVVSGGVRRCLAKGTKVNTKVGLKNIEDIVVGDEVQTKNGFSKVTAVFPQGPQQTMPLETKLGYLECTPNHRVGVGNYGEGYKFASDLTYTDTLVYLEEFAEGGIITELPKDEGLSIPEVTPKVMQFLGWVYGNSCYNRVLSDEFFEELDISETFETLLLFAKESQKTFTIAEEVDEEGNPQNEVSLSDEFYLNFKNYMSELFKGGIPDIIINSTLSPYFGNFVIYRRQPGFPKDELETIRNFFYRVPNNYTFRSTPSDGANFFEILPLYIDNFEGFGKMCRYIETYDIEIEDESHMFFANGILVHNSARMAMKYWKDPSIQKFIDCKNVTPGNVPMHWTTNISVVVDNKFFRALKKKDDSAVKVYETVCNNMVNGNGEPGFINASKMLEGEPSGTEFYVTNPCGEIEMVQYEDMYCADVCCLAHVNLSRVQNPQEAFRLLTRFLIRATFAPVADPRQRENVNRNRRIGVGFFGYHGWLVKNGIKYSDAPNNELVKKFFRNMYEIVNKESISYAHDLRIPVPVKKTTIAPTGTIALLSGDTPSAQSLFSKFFIRRVQFSNNDSELLRYRKEGTRNIEPSLYASNTSVVEFVTIDPLFLDVVALKKSELMKEGMHEQKADFEARQYAIDLIEDQYDLSVQDVLTTQRMLQKEYVDNAISITVNVDPGVNTKESIVDLLKHYLPDLKGVTMFPQFSMPQTPYQKLSVEQLEEYEQKGYPIEGGQAEIECLNGACPIR